MKGWPRSLSCLSLERTQGTFAPTFQAQGTCTVAGKCVP